MLVEVKSLPEHLRDGQDHQTQRSPPERAVWARQEAARSSVKAWKWRTTGGLSPFLLALMASASRCFHEQGPGTTQNEVMFSPLLKHSVILDEMTSS